MRKFLTLLLFVCSLTSVVLARAQQTLGSLNGTVLDASGAAVPDATITATDDAIGVTRTTKAQGNGFFQIFNLPIGTYKVTATHDGFDTTALTGIAVQEAQAKTLTIALKVGQMSESVTVTANPMLNATDTTNGYTLDQAQIEQTPLATGSFTQLAVLSPGVNAELLSGVGSNAGLGNQPIWANGQRDTSNTFQVDGVDSTNLFNGKSSSSDTSQRYNFNIGEGNSVGGATEEGSSVYGSNGNSLPSPPPEFLQELRVNASMYDAQQGATSGAQIDANTVSGTNQYHGQMYGSFANSALNSSPFFFNQEVVLAEQGVGSFPASLRNPLLHRWTTGGTLGGPVIKNKLFFFVAYQHLYDSDQSTGLSQFNVPAAFNTTTCPSGRTEACLQAVAASYSGSTTPITLDPSGVVEALFNATLPNGQYLIPYGPASGAAYQNNVPNVTLQNSAVFTGNQATASIDYDVTKTDRLGFKYYYQNDPETQPFGFSSVGGFPANTHNEAQVGALDNTISIGPRLNWEQRLGYVRMGTYSTFSQTVNNGATGANAGPTFGIANGVPGAPAILPSINISEAAVDQSGTPSLELGLNSSFANTGYYQNRLNPSTNAIFTAGGHTLVVGGGYSYTQLNVQNNRNGEITENFSDLTDFFEGNLRSASTLETLENGKNLADRYYRTNEGAAYAQDKWQALSNLSITAGVRWDYHGGFTEKYGNFFNFDPSAYDVQGTDPAVGGTGFNVINDGLVVAGNNPTAPTAGTSASTLTGRQWGISPRVGFAWAPKRDNGKFVVNGGAGIYYDRGELFTYLSPPAGGSVGGPFGVTQQSPLVSAVSVNGGTIADPLGTAATLSATTTPPAPSVNPAVQLAALQNQLNYMTGTTPGFGLSCGGVGAIEDNCTQTPLYIGFYDKNNVLPYTINYTLNVQWQPRNDLAVTIGYAGNRGRHAVIPIPFNQPQIATAGSPAMILGKQPHSSGETSTYGYEVMDGNNQNCGKYYDPCPIASEPWATYDGGNSDFRAPYVGYSPYAASFETVGNSAYDSLTTHLEKRMSNHYRVGASYTWSHALDEQSDIGLFFTGNNTSNLKQSYASSDFDRRHVFTANFQALLPNAAKEHSALSYLTNDWSLTGLAVLQSGEPYSLYEYNGAVASAQLGYYPSLVNPVLPIKNPGDPKSALTGNPGRFRGTGGNYLPAIDPNQIALQYLAPGQNGVPAAAQGAETDPVDVYETNYGPGDQRNIFRQATQKRLDISIRKEFHVTGRVHLRYAFNIYNVTNTTSMDIPQDSGSIGQHGACASDPSQYISGSYDCQEGYELYGQVITSQADQSGGSTSGPPGGGTAGANLYRLPFTNGTSGKSTSVPLNIPLNAPGTGCSAATQIPGTSVCANNNANFGSVTGVIGSQRIMTMDLHVTF
jgi:hypothetical protein